MATNKNQNEVKPPVGGYNPFEQSGEEETTTEETKSQESTKKTPEPKKSGSAGRGGAKKKLLESDARFLDDERYAGNRKNFSTKLSPELEAKLQGIATLSKMTGQPAGLNSVVAVVHEAVARFVETVEYQDKLQIPKMHGR
ncbi:hypothetical protein [Lentzea sp. NBRC 102530]|uniref:hypothetical protein n=1 Tax=Lentzea sp. NBRC 102530 TaxID=3032201 RepID=UPI0024A30CA7|nr:hypothetical protein [Lentzea sp. NBRC 102530]GLY54831.1 hypothetical protein Lesp01_84860 [Lentzea sp. NBRC 102530]